MDWERQCIRICAGAILLSVLLRLTASGWFEPAVQALKSPDAASFLVYLQTGRLVRLPPRTEPEQTSATQSTEVTVPVFSPSDSLLVDWVTTSNENPDLARLLTQPLSFDLSGEEPTVLILHTHTSECYSPSDSADYRTLEESRNMLRIGDAVTQVLTDAGVNVLHDRTFHDYPSFSDAYTNAAETTAAYIAQYPSIRLILDLHRDAADTAYGQMRTSATVDGTPSAQLMMVVGTDGGRSHPDWEENLSLALKLQVTLEKSHPGLCRNLSLSWQRFNQHYAPGALLIEVGAAGNTLEEALVASNALAEGILTLFGIS